MSAKDTKADEVEGTVYTKEVDGRTVERVVTDASDRVAAVFDGFTETKATKSTAGPGSAGAGSSTRAANNAA